MTDLSAAAWVEDGIGAFDDGVGSLIPDRFDRYARILHPAGVGDPPADVPWSAVAAWAGREMHSLAQFEAISSPRVAGNDPPPWSRRPAEGEPPPGLLRALCEVLARHTSTRKCWLCLWEGYGWIGGSPGPEVSPVKLPQRAYLLFEGSLDSVSEMGWRLGESLAVEHPGPGSDPSQFEPQPPNLFWPDDRAWFVASEIDLDSTYIGGSADLVADLLEDPRLETWPVNRNDQIDLRSDQING